MRPSSTGLDLSRWPQLRPNKMSILSSSALEPLIFNWDFPRRRNLAIAGFLVLSLVVHAACFYIFQIVYPPTLALLPPPARLNLITPDSEGGRTLLRWVEAEDPALASRTQRPADARAYVLPKLEHVPSYITSEPVLKEPPPLVADVRLPSSQPPGAVPMTHLHQVQKIGVVPTRITFSGEIETLGAPGMPSLRFTASTNEPPQAVSFRIAVSRRGEILYSFPVNSSADPALDRQARSYLALCRFPARSSTSDQPLVWGTATIEWGNDVARPQLPATSAPPP
jgi:hypothetical protein